MKVLNISFKKISSSPKDIFIDSRHEVLGERESNIHVKEKHQLVASLTRPS